MASIDLSYQDTDQGRRLATLTINNPDKLNALTLAMMDDLERHCTALERDDDLAMVILTGAGERAFCCGADITAWGALSSRDFARHWVRDGHRIFDRLARLSKPTVAVLNGHALGGGLELAATCDLRIMAPKARLGLPEARVGIIPGWSGTQRLARLLPEPAVKAMALFGQQLTAEQARSWGFVFDVCEAPIERAHALFEQVQDLSPRSVEAAKYLLHAGANEDRAAHMDALASGWVAASDDKAAGVDAFVNKQKARFTGL